ncbi:uncharacterized protein LOC120634057 [Pararge aegeria]|uniref:uncharacterized protein LOC120634057 n=1 Tax=Pararge aegeria TaxID=116150 RepID=UPI0019CFAAC4|nr:uncharacterized protein LOC120634057 [Pararge aegeria]
MAPPAGSNLVVGGVSIAVESTMKYLGLVLDSRWKFEEHFRRLAPKLIGAAGALSRLLPNLGGTGVGCRGLYTGVKRSMAVDALVARNRTLLRRPQRVMAARVIRAYRTISHEAACALAGTPPWDRDAEVLACVHERRVEVRMRGEHPSPERVTGWRRLAQAELFRQWRERLESPGAGLRTIDGIRPVLQQWGQAGSETSWDAIVSFCEDVMTQKEAAERLREDAVDSQPIRRRRVGRRRLAQDRRLPP